MRHYLKETLAVYQIELGGNSEMTDQEYIESLIKKARVALSQIENYNQEQTDKMVRAAGKVVFDNKEILSREAADETQFGQYDQKIRKHAAVISTVWNYMKDKKSVGILDFDPVSNVTTIAKPRGVVAAITPSTNPTSTATFNTMIALKGRNAIIIAPHPKAKNCTKHTVALITEELAKLGAPKDLVQCLEEPTIEMSGILMSSADLIVATGGAGMVKAAYSSGKPAYGVGQGNVQVLMDEDYKDVDKMTTTVIDNRSYDYGILCTGEQLLYIPRKRKKEVVDAFAVKDCYVLDDESVIERIRPIIFPNQGPINRDIVGKTPYEVSKILSIPNVPEKTRLLLIEP
jgi:succinate-semialdehyde dehydrogenase